MMTSRLIDQLRRAALGAAATIMLGCGGATEPFGVAVIPTSGSFAVDDYATFVVRNDGRETIYVERCGNRVSAGLDRRVATGWENEMAAFCVLSFYAGPLPLAPGESVTDSVLVRSAGTFRMFVGYGRGNERILYQARSGGFRVD